VPLHCDTAAPLTRFPAGFTSRRPRGSSTTPGRGGGWRTPLLRR